MNGELIILLPPRQLQGPTARLLVINNDGYTTACPF